MKGLQEQLRRHEGEIKWKMRNKKETFYLYKPSVLCLSIDSRLTLMEPCQMDILLICNDIYICFLSLQGYFVTVC